MKKLIVLLALSSSLFTLCSGQYSVLLNFNASNPPSGEEPEGSLTLSGGKLFGMTYYGGPTSNGNIFSIDTDGNNYKDLFDFNGTNGLNPQGNVTILGGKLYAMTKFGGINGIGNIFSMDTNGNNFKDLHDFSSGFSYPEGSGSLIISGSVLYGMANAGGPGDDGFIFSIDTNGNSYKDLFDFTNTNGANPLGSLTLSRNKFYGMTTYGGTHKCGVVFSVDTNGGNYKVLLNFDTANGAYPGGYLILLRSKLYGMTSTGGLYDSGCIFSIDTDGSDYHRLVDFNGVNGEHPGSSSLTLVGNVLCGTTTIGGAYEGVVFSVDTTGYGFLNLYNDFIGSNGEAPNGVINDGNILYGMTQSGGANNAGVIFKYKQVGLGITNILASTNEIKVYPNPSNGIFNVVVSSKEQGISEIQVYNVLGEKVYSTPSTPSPNGEGWVRVIDLSSQPSGVYFYRVLKQDGGLVGSGKLVIER